MRTNKDTEQILKPELQKLNQSISILIDFFLPQKIRDSLQDKVFQHYENSGTNKTFTDPDIDFYNNLLSKLEEDLEGVEHNYTIPAQNLFFKHLEKQCKMVQTWMVIVPDEYYKRIKLEGDNSKRPKPKEEYFVQYDKLFMGLKNKFLDTAYSHITSFNKKVNLTTIDYALFHYYKQEAKCEPSFNSPFISAVKRQGENYKVGGVAFKNAYYDISKKERRIRKANIPHIQKTIEMLSECPAGKVIAELELIEAELLPSKKLSAPDVSPDTI